MIFFLFLLAAILTVIAAIKLSTYADVLSERTALGGMIVGTFLLAGATSLPEVTTSLSAIVINNPDIAVANVLGSNLFNLLILASFDLYYRKQEIFKHASSDHLYTISIGLLLSIIILLSFVTKVDVTLLGMGIDSLILILIYGLGMYLITRQQRNRHEVEVAASLAPVDEDEDLHNTSAISIKRAIIGFIIGAIVILGSGTLLTLTGDQIAVITGLGSSFVGSFLIAATTSLPEAIAVLIACQLRNYNLAIGSILGSNIFNVLILIGADAFYQQGAILSAVSPVNQITSIGIIILSVIVLYSLLRVKFHSILPYWIPSALLVMIYFISSYLIFSY
ncbi:sodium:calcium antiporter [Anaerobacillus sp. MEB173]|uniref:sodium:calcium antiporter n=1 Tax=Anaerobacillus sp. MEB173 TaxID=3383345 RepID=UPI003F90B543